MKERETFGSRMGFILVSAGCAIGLGNVWRFPYITGQYGGAAFILIYLIFLAILGIPIMVMEFSVGRGSRKSVAASFKELEAPGAVYHHYSKLAMAGNYILMMFYTMVCGWMINYFVKMLSGKMNGLTPDEVGGAFGEMLGNWKELAFWMVVSVVIAFAICSLGLNNGVGAHHEDHDDGAAPAHGRHGGPRGHAAGCRRRSQVLSRPELQGDVCEFR